MKIIDKLLKKGLTGKKVNKVKGIVIHYVANPKSSATANRNYWENQGTGVSAHYIVDLNGDVIRCAPDDAMCYHVGSKSYTSAALSRLSKYPNDCTIGIEMTHPDASGKPNAEIYKGTIELAASLCKKFGLTEKDLWTHKEVVGWKNCHLYYVNNPAAWNKFKQDVGALLKGGKAPVAAKPAAPKAHTKPAAKPVAKKYTLPADILKKGAKGTAVKQLQVALNAAGFNCGTPDGIFGPATEAALKKFQAKYHKPADGIYGPGSKAALAKVLG